MIRMVEIGAKEDKFHGIVDVVNICIKIINAFELDLH